MPDGAPASGPGRARTQVPPPPGGTFTLGGRPVARVGYGAMRLGEVFGRPAPAREDAIAVLRRATALGVDHVDTAQFYGDGAVNERIRAALAPYPDGLTIATKVGAEHRAGALVAAQRPAQLRAAVEANLRALGTEHIALVYLRRLDAAPGIIAEGEQIVDIDAQLAEFTALRDEGKIGAIGLSNVSEDRLRAALPVGIAAVQNAYSVLDRSAEPVLALCAEHGIAWVPYFPLGVASAPRTRIDDRPEISAAARETGATPAQVALAWLLAHADNTLLIPGTASIVHLEENIAAGALHLAARTLAALDALATG